MSIPKKKITFMLLPGRKIILFLLSRDDGTVVHEHSQKCDVAIYYLNNIFSAKFNCTDFMPMINNILDPFTIKEIQIVIF